MIRKQTRPQTLSTKRALDLMRTGSRLVHMHGTNQRWFVEPGGAVTDAVAGEIRNHPSVIAQKDGLFPHHDQTWRMATFAQSE